MASKASDNDAHLSRSLADMADIPSFFTGRPMGGMVQTGHDILEDDDGRRRLLDLALAFNASHDPK